MVQTKIFATILLTITIVKAVNSDGSASVNFSNEKELAEYLNIEGRIQEKQFQKAAQCISNRTTNGIPSLRIPPLDPIKFPILPLFLNNNFIESRMLLRKLKLTGLGQFELEKGTVNIILFQIRLKVVFKKIEFSTKYNGNMKLFKMLKIFGKGDVNISLNNFEVDLIIKYKLKGITSIQLSKLTVKIVLPSTEAKVTGLLHDERMSGLISEQLADALSTLALEQNKPLSDSIQKIGWKILSEQINPILATTPITTLTKLMDDSLILLCGPYMNQFLQHFKTQIEDTLNVELDEDYLNNMAKDYEDMY